MSGRPKVTKLHSYLGGEFSSVVRFKDFPMEG